MFKPNKDQRELCRRVARISWNSPVRVVPGNHPPKVVGRKHYYTTPGGTLIRYPSAYKWKMVYHHSTECVQVGSDWLLSRSGFNTLVRNKVSPKSIEEIVGINIVGD